jgi:uncharacterized membrane protein YdbT with pleckstrin-like domain
MLTRESTMSSRTYFCTLCGHALEGEESWRGRTVTCPACQAQVAIPAPAGTQGAKGAEALATVEPDDERTVFEIAPTAKAYTGELALGGLLVLVALVVAINLLWSGPRWLAWLISVPALGAGGYVLGRIWIRCKSLRYQLTTQRLFIHRGLIAKRFDEIELFRVKDVVVRQNFLQRLLKCGSIMVISTDDTCPRLEMSGLADPLPLKEEIRSCYKNARAQVGLRATEFIMS